MRSRVVGWKVRAGKRVAPLPPRLALVCGFRKLMHGRGEADDAHGGCFHALALRLVLDLLSQAKSEHALRFNMGLCNDQRRTGMRHILIGVGLAAVSVALWPDFSDAQVASIPASSLTGSGVLAIEAGYNKRHLTTYTSRRCYNRDEIRELQRMWPETNWPKSMRCFRYR
jgi:hypothetical protein